MTFRFLVPTATGGQSFQIDLGTSLYFLGANGGGKTRLAVAIEEQLLESAHRISAHRALALNPAVPKIRESDALLGLRTGYASQTSNIHHRMSHRWQSNAPTTLLNDFDFLIQAIFADQAIVSLNTHRSVRLSDGAPTGQTKFEKLNDIWSRLLPHRTLHISGDDIKVSVTGNQVTYDAKDMSDGERAVFYLVGQTLVAAQNSLIIFDEPELHIHRSIMSRLWDELEAARSDCAFLMISHDLEFIASRKGQKFVLKGYEPATGWEIEGVPEQTGFSEEITSLILGSRQPVLFVEGKGSSLDFAIYRACYPHWTIIPRNSCGEVIHSVVTMRANSAMTRITCAGIVDADDYSIEDEAFLRGKGIGILPVAEIENLLLMPAVIEAVLEGESYSGEDLKSRASLVYEELFTQAANDALQVNVALRYARRRIDRMLKKIDLEQSNTFEELSLLYGKETASINVAELTNVAKRGIAEAVSKSDVHALLRWYDNKGVLAIACKAKETTKEKFQQWIVRVMRNDDSPGVKAAIKSLLPNIVAS
jgi:ABC-type branched-subunit amino acid transport system ATPase component